MQKQLRSLLTLAFFMLPLPAIADEAALLQEIKELKERLVAVEQQLKAQQSPLLLAPGTTITEMGEAKAETISARPVSVSQTPSPDTLLSRTTTQPAAIMLNPGLSARAGDTTFNTTAEIQTDMGIVLRDSDRADLGNGTDIRRLRLGINGDFTTDWFYALQMDFRQSGNALIDAFIRYEGISNLPLQIGHFLEYNGLEAQSSNRHLPFIERAEAVTSLRPRRAIGIGLQPSGKGWGGQLGLFGDGLNDEGKDDEGYSITGRGFITPLHSQTHLLHIGTTARLRHPGESELRTRARGEARVIDEYLLDTGSISNIDYLLGNSAEFYYTASDLTFMGEYLHNHITRDQMSSFTQQGGYLSALWSLTGEKRRYLPESGTYDRLVPENPFNWHNGQWGAWEVGLRYSFLDLNERDVKGGAMDSIALALNWYPHANLRMMANYIRHDLDSHAIYPNADPQYFLMRLQMDY